MSCLEYIICILEKPYPVSCKKFSFGAQILKYTTLRLLLIRLLVCGLWNRPQNVSSRNT